MWMLSEAKRRLSEVFELALHKGPQVITRRGKESVVMLSQDRYDQMKAQQHGLKDVLLNSPKLDDVDFSRDP